MMAILYGEDVLQEMVGKSVSRIRWEEDFLLFDTDAGVFGYYVDGDCCSKSYFYDFYGVTHLLHNGPVVSVRRIDLPDAETPHADCTQCYGYELVTVHPQWGEVTSVFSFRNDSNGYYGGKINRSKGSMNIATQSALRDVTHDETGG